jgi:hypothetical protein
LLRADSEIGAPIRKLILATVAAGRDYFLTWPCTAAHAASFRSAKTTALIRNSNGAV